jgi:hypothetical protein
MISSIEMNSEMISPAIYFSIRKVNIIAPLYSNDLLIVSDNLRDWNAFQPPFFTDLQIPKQVSMKIANMAKYIIGMTGESTAQNEANIINTFCLIGP